MPALDRPAVPPLCLSCGTLRESAASKCPSCGASEPSELTWRSPHARSLVGRAFAFASFVPAAALFLAPVVVLLRAAMNVPIGLMIVMIVGALVLTTIGSMILLLAFLDVTTTTWTFQRDDGALFGEVRMRLRTMISAYGRSIRFQHLPHAADDEVLAGCKATGWLAIGEEEWRPVAVLRARIDGQPAPDLVDGVWTAPLVLMATTLSMIARGELDLFEGNVRGWDIGRPPLQSTRRAVADGAVPLELAADVRVEDMPRVAVRPANIPGADATALEQQLHASCVSLVRDRQHREADWDGTHAYRDPAKERSSVPLFEVYRALLAQPEADDPLRTFAKDVPRSANEAGVKAVAALCRWMEAHPVLADAMVCEAEGVLA